MKHTPGPWIKSPAGHHLNIMAAGHGNNVYVASNIRPCDAPLIEASPDLLSALVMAKNWMECEEDNRHNMTEHDRAVYDESMEAINKAIAKATGQ